MLQERGKQSRYSCLAICGLFLTVIACKPDSSSFSEEKAAYLADYEKPAYQWGYINTSGQIVIPADYDDVRQFSENKAAINKAGLWGYIESSGKMIIKPQFRSAYNFHENRARIKPFNQPEYYITPDGKIISSTAWIASDDFSDGRAKVKVGSLYGFIDTSGTLIIRAAFSRAWNFRDGMAVVEFKGQQGVMDRNGKFLIQPEYDHLTIDATSKLILTIKENNSFLLDLNGNEIVQMKGALLKETDGHLVSFQKDDKMFLYSIHEKKNVPGTGYDQLIYPGDQRWSAKYDGVYHLLDDEGKVMNDSIYSQINKFVNGVAVYHHDKFWGYLDSTGKELTKPIFGLAWDYADGFARAAFKDGLTFINKNQEIAFYPPEGTVDMRDFNEGFAPVQMIR